MESTTRSRPSTLERVRREIERNALRARNGISLVSGSAGPATGVSPKETVWSHGRAQLWRYRNDDVRYSPPLLIVSSLVSRSYVLDLTPGNSFIERLVAEGFDVYMFDWGEPDERDAHNQFEDYVDGYIPDAIARVQKLTGAPTVNLFGYCFGGVLALLHAAHNTSSPLNSLTVMAAPVDFHQMGPMGDAFGKTSVDVDAILDDAGNVPASVVLQGFKALAPVAQVTSYVNLFEKLWSEEFVATYAVMTGWANDHIPFPGAVARQTVDMLVGANGFVTDRVTIGGDRVNLADITVPFLSVVATRDHIIPPAAAGPVHEMVGSEEKDQLLLDAGHIGLVVGKTAARTTIPRIIDFLRTRSEAPS
jgi:polyhydroxyalkanoate synthase